MRRLTFHSLGVPNTTILSIIYISHRMEELFRISDRVTVIRDGAYVGTKKTEETNPNELVAMMVGRDLQNFYVRDYNDLTNAKTALEVKNLTEEVEKGASAVQ